MLFLKKDFDEYIEKKLHVEDKEKYINNIRFKFMQKHIQDFLFLYNRSRNYSISKRKEELEREIEEFEKSRNFIGEYGFSYDFLPQITQMKYKIISKFSNSDLQEKRTKNNYENIQKLLNFMFIYFNKKEFFIPYNDTNENSLKIHNLISVEHIIFEKIYNEISRIVSIPITTLNFVNIITNQTNELLNKYSNNIELISTVMNKYFTDNNLRGISENDLPRANFKIMRLLIPQNVNDRVFVSHRNMSSHGDFFVENDNLEKNDKSENISELENRLTSIVNSVSDIYERNYYFRLISFPSSDSTIEDFVIISATSLIEYNYEHYLKDEISQVQIVKIADAFTIIDSNTNSIEKLDFNSILELIKHSIGHNNVSFFNNTIRFTNTKTKKIVMIDLYDYIEIILTSGLAVINSYTNEFRKYNDELKKLGLPEDILPYHHEIKADGNIEDIIQNYTKK